MKSCTFFCAVELQTKDATFNADAHSSQFCDQLQIAAFLWYSLWGGNQIGES